MEGCGRGQDFESAAVGLGTRNRHWQERENMHPRWTSPVGESRPSVLSLVRYSKRNRQNCLVPWVFVGLVGASHRFYCGLYGNIHSVLQLINSQKTFVA